MVARASRSQSSVRPAEVRQRRTDRERRVRHPAGDDDVGAGTQGVGDGLGAQVGIGAGDAQVRRAVAQLREQFGAAAGAGHVVALDHGDAWRAQPELAGELRGCAAPRRPGWPRRSCSRCGCRAPGSRPAPAAACRPAAARSPLRGRAGVPAGPAPASARPGSRRSGPRDHPGAPGCAPPARPHRCGRPRSLPRSRPSGIAWTAS